MNFINQLKETEESKNLQKVMLSGEDMTFRIFEHININDDLTLSIQASFGHYCSPRKTLKDLNDYTSMEFALIDSEGGFIRVTDVLPNFSELSAIEEHCNTVYGFVPVNLIEKLYNELTQ